MPVRLRDERFKTCHIFRFQRLACSGKKQVRSEPMQIHVGFPVTDTGGNARKVGIGSEFNQVGIKNIGPGVKTSAQDMAKYRFGVAGFHVPDGGDDGENKLARRVQFCLESRYAFTAFLGGKELAVTLDRFPQVRRVADMEFIHPDRHHIGAELFAVKLHIQKPVIIRNLVRNRIVKQNVAFSVIYGDELLDLEIVFAGELYHADTVNRNFSENILEFAVRIVPHNDTTLIKLRQRCSKSAVQVLYYFVCIHAALSPFRVFYINCAS